MKRMLPLLLAAAVAAAGCRVRDVRTATIRVDGLRNEACSNEIAKALLRLPDADAQRAALAVILANDMTVAAADAYIDALLSPAEETPPREKKERRRSFILKDVRIFLNTVSRSIDLMKQGGIGAEMKREETEDALVLTISIPKARQDQAGTAQETT